MRRVHLFEFNERPECQAFIRNSVTETLGTLRWGRMGDIVGPAFAQFCRDAGVRRVLDLCIGTGEPVRILVDGGVSRLIAETTHTGTAACTGPHVIASARPAGSAEEHWPRPPPCLLG